MEKEREEERAKLLREMEAIRQQNMNTPTSDYQDDPDGDLQQNRTYELMQSIARIPISHPPLKTSSPDISERVVVGKERERLQSPRFSASPDHSPHSTRSSTSASPSASPEGVVRHTSITQDQINEDTVDINIVDKEEKQLYRLDSESERHGGYCLVTHVNEKATDAE